MVETTTVCTGDSARTEVVLDSPSVTKSVPSSVPVDSITMSKPSSTGCCTKHRLIQGILASIVVGGVFILVFGLTGGGKLPGPMESLPVVPDLSDFTDIFLTDPWEGGENITKSWEVRNKRGLELTIVNSLTTDWYVQFDQAVEDWDNGIPDALTLSTTVVPPISPDDPKRCEQRLGRMIVCNGDFGHTGYKGVNEVLVRSDHIVASVAQMNEYYMKGASDGAKQYLMCHEIGHGFGLGHPNENFYNRDLGTCMDYTKRPARNQRPNQDNFNHLYDAYGEVPTLTRRLRRTNLYNNKPSWMEHEEAPSYKSFMESSHQDRRDKWRLLHRHESNRGEVHEQDLGNGYRVHAHVMLHVDD